MPKVPATDEKAEWLPHLEGGFIGGFGGEGGKAFFGIKTGASILRRKMHKSHKYLE